MYRCIHYARLFHSVLSRKLCTRCQGQGYSNASHNICLRRRHDQRLLPVNPSLLCFIRNVPEEILELKFKELLLYILHNPANEALHNHLLSIREKRNKGGTFFFPINRYLLNQDLQINLSTHHHCSLTNPLHH